MKRGRINMETVKRIVITMLILTAVVVILDLYVPLKRTIVGDNMSFNEILSYVKFKQHLPYILIVGFAIGIFSDKKDK